jgi:two-component system NarL family sensor kinase
MVVDDDLAAALVEVKRLARERSRLIRESLDTLARERRRVADLLHDEVLQELLFARHELGSSSALAEPSVAGARSSVDAAIMHLRTLSQELHPILLSRRGLSATIEELARTQGDRSGLQVTTALSGDPSSRHDPLVFSAVRELLTNVVKHAQATAAEITMSVNGELVLEVCDNGTGLDPKAIREAVASGHIGLASLMDSVDVADGKLEFTDAPDSTGALVRITLPLP